MGGGSQEGGCMRLRPPPGQEVRVVLGGWLEGDVVTLKSLFCTGVSVYEAGCRTFCLVHNRFTYKITHY